MIWGEVGLTAVGTSDLKSLLRLLHRGELEAPLVVSDLARCGLQHCATGLLSHLRGLDAAAVKAVLVAVIAERSDDEPVEEGV